MSESGVRAPASLRLYTDYEASFASMALSAMSISANSKEGSCKLYDDSSTTESSDEYPLASNRQGHGESTSSDPDSAADAARLIGVANRGDCRFSTTVKDEWD